MVYMNMLHLFAKEFNKYYYNKYYYNKYYNKMHNWLIIFIIIIFIIIYIGIVIGKYQLLTFLNNPNRKSATQLISEAKKGAKIEELVGTWEIDDPRVPIKKITIPANTIGIAKKHEKHYLDCNACNDNPVGFVEVPSKYVVFKKGLFANMVKSCVHDLDYIYKLVLHNNGVIKFVIHPKIVVLRDLIIARSDSKSLYGLILNLIHRQKYGCFCLGILSPDGNSIQRYNRWADKYPDKYYTMRKISNI
jgi:hypothetical protein